MLGLGAPPLGTLAALGVFGGDIGRNPVQLRKPRAQRCIDGLRTRTDEAFGLYGYDVHSEANVVDFALWVCKLGV